MAEKLAVAIFSCTDTDLSIIIISYINTYILLLIGFNCFSFSYETGLYLVTRSRNVHIVCHDGKLFFI